ncbi:MAG: hypothetical protein HKN75_08540 [Bacteroidia bacterium]|nr:hypothetical protein [Bacteroidia bacterium]
MFSKIFHGIGDFSEMIFDILPSFGWLVNLLFIGAIAVGVFYYTFYEHKVGSKGGDNYLSR